MYSSRRMRYQANSFKQKLMLYAVLGIIGLMIFGSVISLGVFAWFAKDLPAPGKLSQATQNSTVFYDREGKVLFEMYKDKNRVPVKITDISDDLKKGVVATEDRDFYKHQGISWKGLFRALVSRGTLGGGSTITQQLIKNVLLDSQHTASRKIKEIILAFEVERRYSKDQILEMYLNEVPYGGTFYGIESAARGYFGKEAKNLTLTEAAFLAGLPQSPSYYSPFIGHNDSWKGRTKDVLRRMREDGYITKAQELQSGKEIDAMKFTTPQYSITAPHFVFYVKEQLEKEFGTKILDQGLKVKTTLSLDVQLAAEKIVKNEIESLKGLNVGNGATVVLDSQTGEILAMVGSYDYNNKNYGEFNAATGRRQPGSSIKPITYALAFEKGYTPATVLMDVKTSFPNQGSKDYEPVNYDGKFRGPVQLRFALGNSLNIPAVKLLAMVGIRDFMTKAGEAGLDGFAPTPDNMKRFGLAITLGGAESSLLDMTSAFSIFARGGLKRETSAINEVTDFKGKTIYKSVKAHETKVFTPESSFLISHILADNNARVEAFGSNSYLRVAGKTVAVKTGTTDDKRDNWAIGFTKSITVGVWVGNNDNSPMNPKIASGVTGASPIWHDLMVELLKKYPDGIMDKPDKVKAVTIDTLTGGLPKDGNPTRSEYFIEGTEPKDISPIYKKVKISRATGKIANDVEIRQGNVDEKEFIVFTENDPVSTDGKNRWQEAIDAWVRDQHSDKYPPTETSDASSDAIVTTIKSPEDHSTVTNNNVEIKARFTSLAAVKKVEVYINGNKVRDLDGNRDEIDETVNEPDGVYELKVVARNDRDKASEQIIHFGVNKPWDSGATPTPTPKP